MTFKLFIMTILSTGLISCSNGQAPLGNHLVESEVHFDKEKNLKGFNLELTDSSLVELLKETHKVEEQLQQMNNRLTTIRNNIIAYRRNTKSNHALKEPPMLGLRAVEPVEIEPASGNSIQPVERQTLKPRTVIVSQKQPIKSVEVEKTETKVASADKIDSKMTNKGENGVYKVRYGRHPDKTRLVFDAKQPIKNVINFDKQAGVLTITLPETSWSTSTSEVYGLPQLSGYEAKQSGEGTIIAMAVNNTSDVKITPLTSPNRLVVDLIK